MAGLLQLGMWKNTRGNS